MIKGGRSTVWSFLPLASLEVFCNRVFLRLSAFSSFVALVSGSEEVYSVAGGNRKFPEAMIAHSEAAVRLSTTVTKVTAIGQGYRVEFVTTPPLASP